MKNEYYLPLPGVLSEEEQDKLIEEKTKESRKKLISCNIRLVIYEVKRRFNNTKYEIEELISIGTIGLIKGIDSYNSNKKIKLSTYLVRCIDNEILMLLRKKQENEMSIDEKRNNEDKPINFHNILFATENDIEKEVENKQLMNIIYNIIEELSDKEKKIIIYSFGLYGNERLTQQAIAEKLGISRSYVHKILNKTLEKIKEILINTYDYEIKKLYN